MPPFLIALFAAVAIATVSAIRPNRAQAASQPNGPNPGGGKLGIVHKGSMTSPFGPRGAEGVHAGIDIAAERGTPVRAAESGLVVDISPNGTRTGYGNTVILEHGDRTLTLYAHMDMINPELQVGRFVEQGHELGTVGSTHLPEPPDNMKPHVHFETHTGKAKDAHGRLIVNPNTPKRMDPMVWLRRKKQPIADAA